MWPRIYALSERALTIEVGGEISEAVFERVMGVRRQILESPFPGLVEITTAYTTVTVYYDPLAVRRASQRSTLPASQIVGEYVRTILDSKPAAAGLVSSDLVVIPVCYDEEFAPDLAWVASFHNITAEAIVREHTAHTFTVFMVGFTPGFPYMGILPPALESPRHSAPRTSVPAGSVGLAGKQTGIYPFATPGGWQIIGRTPWPMFDVAQTRPARLKAGDRVRFQAISKIEFNGMIA